MKSTVVPTPEQIATHGHIAARLRAEMAKRDLTVRRLNIALGLPVNNTALYAWLACRSAPTEKYRRKLSQVLEIPEAELMVRAQDYPMTMPAVIEPKAPRPVDVLAFTINDQGEARIRLDLTLPVDRGGALLRLLLDAGVVMTGNPE